MWSAGPGDDKQRFLADLRALRGAAALGYDELAARTHYPDDILKEAESGPSLPGLPVLAAYVRACDGDVPEWEERWRRLGFGADADPGLPARPAGASPAAEAGARASVGVAPPDAYDPDRIRAVLRGIHQPEQGATGRGSAAATVPPRPPEFAGSWSAGTSQDAGWGETAVVGRREAAEDTVRRRPGWDTSYQPEDRADYQGAEQAGYQRDERAGSQHEELVGYQRGERVDCQSDERTGFQHEAEDLSGAAARPRAYRDEPSGAAPAADSWFTRPEPGAREATAEAADAATESWFAPRELTDAGRAPHAVPGDQPDAGVTPASQRDERVDAGFQPVADLQPVADFQPPGTAPSSSAPAGPARERRSDRVSLVRLLLVIVVAAIIGSVLVLVLH